MLIPHVLGTAVWFLLAYFSVSCQFIDLVDRFYFCMYNSILFSHYVFPTFINAVLPVSCMLLMLLHHQRRIMWLCAEPEYTITLFPVGRYTKEDNRWTFFRWWLSQSLPRNDSSGRLTYNQFKTTGRARREHKVTMINKATVFKNQSKLSYQC